MPPSHPRLPSYTPVAIFVGGISGIGQGMAVAFACHTKGNAHIVLVGRNRATTESVLATFRPGRNTRIHRMRHDTDVECSPRRDRAARAHPKDQLSHADARGSHDGRIDRKLTVHYYGRWHFIKDLLPAVEAAKKEGEDGKVMSVLAAGWGGKIDLRDLGLKKSFGVANARAATLRYTDIMINDGAARQPALTFIHAHRGVVASNLYKLFNTTLVRAANTFLAPLLAPFIYSEQSAGEHQLYTLLKVGPSAVRTGPKGDDIGLTKGYYGSKEAMERLWAHTEEATKARRICSWWEVLYLN
ncbi:hypothetical protein B0H13DRAFT_2577469 [Mycena leptocephala]|nr:hypothetical protein B0H13DRAFT_2577469 [Mycena leptocephala]